MRIIIGYSFIALFYETVGQTISVGGGVNSVCLGKDIKSSVHAGCDQQESITADRLVRLETTKVGEVVEITIGNRKINRITRAIQPPVYGEWVWLFTRRTTCTFTPKGANHQKHVSFSLSGNRYKSTMMTGQTQKVDTIYNADQAKSSSEFTGSKSEWMDPFRQQRVTPISFRGVSWAVYVMNECRYTFHRRYSSRTKLPSEPETNSSHLNHFAEIPDFLTKEECTTIISTAEEQGLKQSMVFDINVNVTEDIKKKDLKDVWRVSNTSFIKYHGEVLNGIREKVVQLTGLPKRIVFGSEPLQVLRYGPGGHYHAHWDSENTKPLPGFTIGVNTLPCCHQTEACKIAVRMPMCCRVCRFATVLFYLNDVEEGGETAFPFARLKEDDKLPEAENRTEGNLSYNCHTARLVVKPRRGTAILWYSHFLDKEGWMDRVDVASYHGGCDIIKGEKWIANTWINAGEYKEKDLPSIWTDK